MLWWFYYLNKTDVTYGKLLVAWCQCAGNFLFCLAPLWCTYNFASHSWKSDVRTNQNVEPEYYSDYYNIIQFSGNSRKPTDHPSWCPLHKSADPGTGFKAGWKIKTMDEKWAEERIRRVRVREEASWQRATSLFSQCFTEIMERTGEGVLLDDLTLWGNWGICMVKWQRQT